jgi:APA family basic amino acid/polyamine antiporter
VSAGAAKLERTTQPVDLVRGLGLWSATAIVVSDIIGSGIFLVTSDMARALGSAALVFAAWITGGVIVLFGSFCFAELGAALPQAGGRYVYLSRALGPIWGFLFGWMVSFLQRPVSMATLAAGFLRFTGFLFPAVTRSLFVFHLGRDEFTFTVAQPLAAVVVMAITMINYLSVKTGGAIQLLLGSVKVITILTIVIGGLFFGKHVTEAAAPMGVFPGLGAPGLGITISAFLTALVSAMWAYNGFQDLGDLGEEVSRPEKNIPRALILGLLIVAALYLLANVVYFRTLPFEAVARSQHIASDVVQSFAGPRGAVLLTLAMAMSALAANHVVVLTGARIPYAMARDRVFFQFARRIHPRFHSPSGAVVFLGVLAALLALTGTFEELYSLFIFGEWIFLALSALALFRLRAKEPALARPYKAWGYPFTPLVFFAAALALTINLWMVRPVRSSLGLLVILAGVPFFFHWSKSATPSSVSANDRNP